jgi:hypothetical protein
VRRAGPIRQRLLSESPRRADAGKFRLDPRLQEKLGALFVTTEPLRMSVVERELHEFCRRTGLRVPSRAALYRARRSLPLQRYRKQDLPEAVQASLYNLSAEALVPGEQIAFYAFNYGSTGAMSFASGLPVVWLERAERLPGWRPKSRSVLQCVLLRRRASDASLPTD